MFRLIILLIILVVAIGFVFRYLYGLYRQVNRENAEDILYLQEETEVYKQAKRDFYDAVDEAKRQQKNSEGK